MAAPRGPGAGRPRWDVTVRLFPKHPVLGFAASWLKGVPVSTPSWRYWLQSLVEKMEEHPIHPQTSRLFTQRW